MDPLQQQSPRRRNWRHFFSVLGPGVVVMLADTDAGSIITAAQSGVSWGYQLLWLQIVLVPVLFMTQELTVRLGLVTGRGFAELIREVFGMRWAVLSVLALAIICLGALFTEFAGMAGVGLLFGVPVWASMLLVASGLIATICSGSYRSVERTAAIIGAFELVFIFLAYQAHPHGQSMLAAMANPPFSNAEFQYLIAANIGAVIMPWMIFYQQSAVVDKALGASDLEAARWDTLIGALITQAVMVAVLILGAESAAGAPGQMNAIEKIAATAMRFFDPASGKILFALGMGAAAMIGSIVVSLTIAWSVGEVFGFKRSLDHRPSEAPWFYGIFSIAVILAALVVASGVNLVRLSVAVEVMNALLLPFSLGMLFLLARNAPGKSHRLQGPYSALVGLALLVVSATGIYTGVSGILG